MAFGVEELEQIDIALRDAERGGRGVEVDFRFCGGVQAAQVDDQLAVDEDPQVVVSFELEGLAAGVLELRVKLGREGEVVLLEVVAVGKAAPAGVVDGKEVLAVEGGDVAFLGEEKETVGVAAKAIALKFTGFLAVLARKVRFAGLFQAKTALLLGI